MKAGSWSALTQTKLIGWMGFVRREGRESPIFFPVHLLICVKLEETYFNLAKRYSDLSDQITFKRVKSDIKNSLDQTATA